MIEEIIAIVLTCGGIWAISYVLHRTKGLKLKYGVVGMILMFMPYSLGIGTASSNGEALYSAIMLISVIAGFTIFVSEVPGRQVADQELHSEED